VREPLNLLLVGGSHLGSGGLPPTTNFGVLLSRALRTALGCEFGRTRSIFHEGDSTRYVDVLPSPLPASTVVLLLPRNLLLVPMLGNLRVAAAARVLKGKPLWFRSVFVRNESPPREAVRRLWLLLRCLAGIAYATGSLVLLPRRLRRYARGLDGTVAELRSRGSRLIVLTTPIPVRDLHFPLARLYQAAYASVIRSRAQPGVAIVDLAAVLATRRQAVLQPEDPCHLNAHGHRLVADAVLPAILEGIQVKVAAG
jgi:hypothetical protein